MYFVGKFYWTNLVSKRIGGNPIRQRGRRHPWRQIAYVEASSQCSSRRVSFATAPPRISVYARINALLFFRLARGWSFVPTVTKAQPRSAQPKSMSRILRSEAAQQLPRILRSIFGILHWLQPSGSEPQQVRAVQPAATKHSNSHKGRSSLRPSQRAQREARLPVPKARADRSPF